MKNTKHEDIRLFTNLYYFEDGDEYYTGDIYSSKEEAMASKAAFKTYIFTAELMHVEERR